MEGVIDSAQSATNWRVRAFTPCGYDGASASPEDPNEAAGVQLAATEEYFKIPGRGIVSKAEYDAWCQGKCAEQRDLVRPLAADQGWRTVNNTIRDHLTAKDLGAAADELDQKWMFWRDGSKMQHLREVREAQQSLLNRIQYDKQVLSRPGLPDVNRLWYEGELSKASRWLDISEQFVPR